MNKNKKTVGVYAGSFNPFHCGHADILHQALEVFDEVIIAPGQNPMKDNKEYDNFPDGHPILGRAKVIPFTGLLSDFLNELKGLNKDNEIFLVRGLRNGEDLQYEQNQLQFIKGMYPSLKTVFFICDKKFEHISSSALRALKKVSENEYKKYTFESKTESSDLPTCGWGDENLCDG
jgi:pantetheine-phosphate adenylyltransferase